MIDMMKIINIEVLRDLLCCRAPVVFKSPSLSCEFKDMNKMK